MTEVDPVPTAGSQVGRYQFLREIAKGPLGALYELRAEAGSGGLDGLGRLVPLRNDLLPEVEQSIAAAAWDSMEIRHDSVLCVADVVFGEGWVMLIHDYVEGTLLRSLQRRATERQSVFPLAIALRIVLDMLEGQDRSCSVCESAGITWNPGATTATSLYLCGDGRTRLLDGQLMASLIRDRQMLERLGTSAFLAPELFDPECKPDERTDVFVAGVVLWELLTGKELTLEIDVVRGQRPRSAVPNVNFAAPPGTPVPHDLAQTVNAALELDPSRRIATRSELRSALTARVEAANYEKVIDFVDALLHRESTLFRLTLDPRPKLSDKLRSERPGPPRLERGAILAKRTSIAKLPRVSTVQLATNSGNGKSDLVQASEPQAKPSPRTAITAASTTEKKAMANRTLIGINPAPSFAPQPRTSVAIDAKRIPIEPHSEVAKVAESISIPVVEPPPVDTSDTDQTVVRYNLNTAVETNIKKDSPIVAPIFAPEVRPANNSPPTLTRENRLDSPQLDPNYVSEVLRDLPNVVASIMSDVRQVSPAVPAPALEEPLLSADSPKPARKQVIQLNLPILVIVQLITVAVAVLATIVIQRVFWHNSPEPSVSASIAAPVMSVAPTAAPNPEPAAPTTSLEATATVPQPSSAPSGEPSAATVASTSAIPLTPTTASAVPTDIPTAPKIVIRKRKRGYVPHGL